MQTKLNEIQFSVAIFNQRKQNVKRNIVTPSKRLLIRTVCTATRFPPPPTHSDNMLLQQLCSNAKLSGMFDVEIPQLKQIYVTRSRANYVCQPFLGPDSQPLSLYSPPTPPLYLALSLPVGCGNLFANIFQHQKYVCPTCPGPPRPSTPSHAAAIVQQLLVFIPLLVPLLPSPLASSVF